MIVWGALGMHCLPPISRFTSSISRNRFDKRRQRRHAKARAKQARGVWGIPPRKARITHFRALNLPSPRRPAFICTVIGRPERSEPRGIWAGRITNTICLLYIFYKEKKYRYASIDLLFTVTPCPREPVFQADANEPHRDHRLYAEYGYGHTSWPKEYPAKHPLLQTPGWPCRKLASRY
jgi:hypothetical protein